MHVNPVILILTIILVVVFIVLRRRQAAQSGGTKPSKPKASGPVSPRPPKPEKKPEEVFMDVRRQALATQPESVGMTGQFGPDEPYGALMEMWIGDSVVTLACFANGDATFCFKSGGGMSGGGGHEPVRKAAQAFVALAQNALPAMSPAVDQPLPERDRVRFYVLTPRGIVSSETGREALGEADNALAPLFYAGQEVVTQLRQVQGQRAR
jgi:hypothetical protein